MGNDALMNGPIIVSEESLKKAQNDIQLFVECSPPKSTILFAVPSINVPAPILIDKPLNFGVMNVSTVKFACPQEGTVFAIEYVLVLFSYAST